MEGKLQHAFQTLTGAIKPTSHSGGTGELSHFQPWNRDDYLLRLGSFRISTWFSKSNEWSAPECARRGWCNVSKDKLECGVCEATIEHTSGSAAALLATSHRPLCSWQSASCPVSFIRPRPLKGRPGVLALERAASNILSHLLEGCVSRSAGPAIHLRVSSTALQHLSSAARAAAQTAQLPETQTSFLASAAENVLENVRGDSSGAGAASLALALCGWRAQPAAGAERIALNTTLLDTPSLSSSSGVTTGKAPLNRVCGSPSQSPAAGSKRKRSADGIPSPPTAVVSDAAATSDAPQAHLQCQVCGAITTITALLDRCVGDALFRDKSDGNPVRRRGLHAAAQAAVDAASRAISAFEPSAAEASHPDTAHHSVSAGVGDIVTQTQPILSLLKRGDAGYGSGTDGSGIDPLQGHKWHCSAARAAYALPVATLRRLDSVSGSAPQPTGPSLQVPTLSVRGMVSVATPTAMNDNSGSASSGPVPIKASDVDGDRVAAALVAVSTATLGVTDMKLVTSILRSQSRQASCGPGYAGGQGAGTGSSALSSSAAGAYAGKDGGRRQSLKDILSAYDFDVDSTPAEEDGHNQHAGSTAPVLIPGWLLFTLALYEAVN